MQIRSKALSYGEIVAIIDRVSAEQYGGNVRAHQDSRALYSHGHGYAGRIDARNSREAGARRSWSGRRTTAACWHAFRDVFRAVFAADPNARIVTSMARYDAAGYEDQYPRTADHNVGSVMAPAYMPDLCDCDDFE